MTISKAKAALALIFSPPVRTSTAGRAPAGTMSGLWSGNPASIKLSDLDVICATGGDHAGRARRRGRHRDRGPGARGRHQLAQRRRGDLPGGVALRR